MKSSVGNCLLKKKKAKRIYIVGAVASGKTTLAKILSKQLNIPWYELDNIYHLRLPEGSKVKPSMERDIEFDEIIYSDSWIIEGVRRKCFDEGFEKADLIIFLDTHPIRRSRFILKRWVRQRLQLEKSNYVPTLGMFIKMYEWSFRFEKNKDEFITLLEDYKEKVVVHKSLFNFNWR